MECFKERVSKFWKYFKENEQTLRSVIDNYKDENTVSEYINNILNIAFSEIYFEAGKNGEGKYELILTPEGDKVKFIAINYWFRQMDKSLLDKWNFYTTIPEYEDKKTFSLEMFGINFKNDDFLIYAYPDNEDEKVNIEVYCDKFKSIEQNQRYSVLLIMLDQNLGEFYTMNYIGFIDFIDSIKNYEFSNIPLEELKNNIDFYIDENNWNRIENPCNVYISYSFKPIESKNFKFREDVVAGTTSCYEIINDYYNNEKRSFDILFNDGIVLGFIFYDNTEIEKENIVEHRGNIEDKIHNAVYDSGIGESIGGASGKYYSYMDFVIYDIGKFMSIVQNIIKEYNLKECGFSKFFFNDEVIMF